MKKTLVAIAALASVSAFAQSTVTIDGVMDANYTSAKAFGQSYSLVNQSGARTTSIKFMGSEDLGGGTKANFRFEVQPSIIAGNGNAFSSIGTVSAGTQAANAAAQTSGQASPQSGLVGKGYSFVGVSGGFGEVQLGTINSAVLSAYLNAAGRTGTGVGSGYNFNLIPDLTRVESAVAYFTPTVSGIQGRLMMGTGNDSQYGSTTGVILRRNTTNELGLSYANGPIKVNYASMQVKTSPNEIVAAATSAAASNVTTTSNALSASYNLGNLNIGALNLTQKNNAGADTGGTNRMLSTSTMMIYSSYQMGATRLLLNTGSRKTNNNYASTTNLAGLKTTFAGYGVEYDLSKRTYVYFRGSNQTVNDLAFTTTVVNGAALTASPTDKGISVNAIGVSHSF
jgi:predicted porin